jgi:hypothetical protein
MSIEYYPVPKGKVFYNQLKSDIGRGNIEGLYLNRSGKPEMGGFYIEDNDGNALVVYSTGQLSFVDYEKKGAWGKDMNDAYNVVSTGKRKKIVRKIAKRIHVGAKKYAKKEDVSFSEGIEHVMKKKSTWRGGKKYI